MRSFNPEDLESLFSTLSFLSEIPFFSTTFNPEDLESLFSTGRTLGGYHEMDVSFNPEDLESLFSTLNAMIEAARLGGHFQSRRSGISFFNEQNEDFQVRDGITFNPEDLESLFSTTR